MIIKYFQPCLLIMLPLYAGCVSMEGIQQYAHASKATLTEVKPVARDFYESCIRSNRYKPLQFHSECNNEQQASRAINLLAEILHDYVTALDTLASDEPFYYDRDLNRLVDEINELDELDRRQLDAIGNLANHIAVTATQHYQSRQAADLIRAGNASVIILSDSLADIIDQNYSQAMRHEIAAWKASYRKLEKSASENTPLDWEIYSQQQLQYLLALQRKIAASHNLAENVRKIARVHQSLVQEAGQSDSEQVLAIVTSFINDTRPVIKDIQTSFNP